MPIILETKDMSTDTIEITVSELTAQKYQSISEAEKQDIEILLNALLSRLPESKRSLEEIAKQASATAKANGLTEEILEKLLDEE